MTEREIKLERVRGYLATHGLAGVLLTTTANFAWATGGASNHVGLGTETGAASLLVTPDACVLIASIIERARLEAEEAGEGMTVESFPWHAPDLPGIVRRYAGHGRVAADTAVAGTRALGPEFAPLRYSLLPEEIERYRRLGEDAALCVTRACFEARPGLSEHRVAGLLAGDLHALGIAPTLLLVGADERAFRFRHPIPTERRLEEHVLIAVGARRSGLIVSLTRLVHFGPLPAALRRRHDAVARVDAAFHHATHPGARVADIFAAGASAYARAGFPDAWQEHHQGGATGYAPRDYRATPESPEVVQPHQAFAWNPTIAGTKSEDTIIATPAGPEVLTATPDLPIVHVAVESRIYDRPDILVR
jgi:antitoxin VapB